MFINENAILLHFIQLVFEARLHETASSVGLDDLFIANGTCCALISTPEDTAKGNSRKRAKKVLG